MRPTIQQLALAALLASVSAATAAQAELEQLKERIATRLPAAALGELAPSPLTGLYELTLPGQVVYVSADGRYLVSGRMIDLETREDLTERVLARQRLSALDAVPEERMIVFDATAEPRHTITTFTDIDCPYCRKMHAEMDALNAKGVRVRYMLFPRAGFPSVSYEKAVSVWCAPDQQAEMTRAKRGAMPEKRECPNPVEEHMALARQLGLRGTPFTITDTGRVIGGYMPASELFDSLESDKGSGKP